MSKKQEKEIRTKTLSLNFFDDEILNIFEDKSNDINPHKKVIYLKQGVTRLSYDRELEDEVDLINPWQIYRDRLLKAKNIIDEELNYD